MRRLTLLTLLFVLLCIGAPAYALNQPAVNLGFTNFLDGASPGPGWYWTEYLQVIHATDLENDAALPKDINLDGFINLNQIIYQSNASFLGGNPGLDIIVPLVDIDAEDHPVVNAQDGVGDILVGPFMQWGPHMLFGRPYFHRVELQVTAPIGDNSSSKVINPGADVWTINPYYAFTYFLTPKLSTSVRFHYLWSSENNNFSDLFPGADIQPGQAIHFNYAAAYAVTETIRLGVSGYYLKQLEKDDVSGGAVAPGLDNKEEVFAVGPGLVWHINPSLTFMGAINWESMAENRPEGVRSTLRLVWKFW